MDGRKHIAVSLTASAIILIVFRRMVMSAVCFLSGVMLDLDHVLDYYLNYRMSAGESGRVRQLPGVILRAYLQRQQCRKVYKILHSVELLILFPIFYFAGIRGEVITGIFIGFMIHLSMDFIALGHIGAVSLIYKIKNGFPCGSTIVKQRLSGIGKDLDRCQFCGARCETEMRIPHIWYIGFTRRGLKKIEVLCPDCYHKESGADKSG